MKVKAVTFDCAQTLLAVDWKPAMVAVECARSLGLDFDAAEAASHYDRLLRSGWPEFKELNLTRDPAKTDAFWSSLTAEWAAACGFGDGTAARLLEAAETHIFGARSRVFSLFDDVVPTLEALKAGGLRLGVVSNWDSSLHKTLRAFGLADWFDAVVASMEEGVEKPDPAIFQIALDRLGVEASDAVHVGDNPMDDYYGAKRAGMDAFVVDRSVSEPANIYIGKLTELPARLGL